MKTQLLLTTATCLAISLGISASGHGINSNYAKSNLILQDTVDDGKTDADSLPIPAPGRSSGKLDSTPFPQDTPRPVDPTPTPKPADPPVAQPAQPKTADTPPKD